ncbi:MAG: DUF1425 domain-containing protein [Planctomycetes bacterium]|nr:DUF1425 domain-containing protein [Planctomycetota bacterium]
MVRSLSCIFALAACLFLASCRGTSGVNTRVDVQQPVRTVEIGDAWLNERVQLLNIMHRFEGDLLVVQAQVKNSSRDTVRCEYNVIWYDMTGWEMSDAVGGWKPLLLEGLDQKAITMNAPKPGANTFLIKLRRDTAIR